MCMKTHMENQASHLGMCVYLNTKDFEKAQSQLLTMVIYPEDNLLIWT